LFKMSISRLLFVKAQGAPLLELCAVVAVSLWNLAA